MKRIPRNPEKFEVIDLFSSIGRKYNYNIHDPHSKNDFIKKVTDSLNNNSSNKQLLYGKRIEKAFAFVVSGIGDCLLLKQEDSGDLFCKEDILPPDYRVITKAGEQYLVEVKNCHNDLVEKKFTLQKAYVTKLLKYSELIHLPLKFAVFFSKIGKWCLLSLDSFDYNRGKYSISFADSYAHNEMYILGDIELGTTPDITIEFVTNHDEAVEIGGCTEVTFIIREVNFFCNDVPIQKNIEKKLALYLARYGSWEEKIAENIIVNNRLIGVRLGFSPELPSEGQNFQFIGTLSEMISRAYSEHTDGEDGIKSIDTEVIPKSFSPVIPFGYKGEALPLWRFSIRPKEKKG